MLEGVSLRLGFEVWIAQAIMHMFSASVSVLSSLPVFLPGASRWDAGSQSLPQYYAYLPAASFPTMMVKDSSSETVSPK